MENKDDFKERKEEGKKPKDLSAERTALSGRQKRRGREQLNKEMDKQQKAQEALDFRERMKELERRGQRRRKIKIKIFVVFILILVITAIFVLKRYYF